VHEHFLSGDIFQGHVFEKFSGVREKSGVQK
jgi:hypothetical protein